jgi:hypothetical protein
MTAISYGLHGVRDFACAPDGKKLRTGQDVVDLIGEATQHGAEFILVPVERSMTISSVSELAWPGTSSRNSRHTGGAWRLPATSHAIWISRGDRLRRNRDKQW